AIIGLLEGAGATPVEKPEFTFPEDAFSSEASILELAATFEPVGVGAYLGAGPMIQDPAILAAAGSIEAVEGMHVVAINNLIGVSPPANEAFPAALSEEEVLAAIAPFLGMSEMPDTGGSSAAGHFGRV
ncbi:MAG: ferritin-like domain-containing protein, partial [Actinomycetota bacterium]|nr:ferritin-like domain-containing protein [Actinomycetota bacterium]